MSNIIIANFNNNESFAAAGPLWQYDYGQILQITGLDLPDAYQVHFCNKGDLTTIEMIGDAGGVAIPDNLLATGLPIYAYVFLHAGEEDGETLYKVIIPVNKRPVPANNIPTPTQQSAIDQAIAALQKATNPVLGVTADGYLTIAGGEETE